MSDLNSQLETALHGADWPQLTRLTQQLVKSGHQARAWHWQALAAVHQNQLAKAANLYDMALRQEPANLTLAQQAAALALQLHHTSRAVSILKTLLKTYPNHIDVQGQLAQTYIQGGQIEEAQTLLATLTANPAAPVTAHVMQWVLQNQLSLPQDAPTPNALAGKTLGPLERTQVWMQQIVKMWHLRDAGGLETAIQGLQLAVQDYEAQPLDLMQEKQRPRLLNAFNGFIRLFKILRQQVGTAPAADPTLPPLWILGDSHGLSPLGQTATLAGQPHQLHHKLVTGIKYKHVAEGTNTYTAQLHYWLKNLPENQPVILSMGEIDLRDNEGIWHHHKKTGLPLDKIIAGTFAPAISELAKACQILCPTRPVMLSGLPQPGAFRLALVAPEGEAFKAMVASAEAALQAAARQHGFPVVPLYQHTGSNEAFFHGDGHLQPTVLPQAISALKL